MAQHDDDLQEPAVLVAGEAREITVAMTRPAGLRSTKVKMINDIPPISAEPGRRQFKGHISFTPILPIGRQTAASDAASLPNLAGGIMLIKNRVAATRAEVTEGRRDIHFNAEAVPFGASCRAERVKIRMTVA